MAGIALHPSLSALAEVVRADGHTLEGPATVAVLPWPEAPDARLAWVAWVPEGGFDGPLQAGADAIATPSCPLGARIREAELRRARRVRAAAHAALVRLASDPMEVIGEEGRLDDVNPAWERQTGIARVRALGRSAAELFRAGIHPDSFYQALQHELDTRHFWRGMMISALPDGGLAFQDAAAQQVRERGATIVTAGVRRVLAGAEVPEGTGDDVLHALAQAQEATLVLDAKGVVVACNPPMLALLGQDRAARIGRTFTPFELGIPLARLLPSPGSHALVDTTLLTARGPLEVEISATGATGGMRAFVVWVVRDITARKHTERALIEAREAAEAGSRAKSRFLANMSHELRTPLNIILGYAELLEESVDDPQVLTDLGRIRQAGSHLLSLVGDILDLARIESGRAELAPEPTDLGALVASVGAEVLPIVEARGNRLEVHVQPVQVLLDPRRMRQVLLNLVGNASKFTEDGVIALRLELGADELVLHVEDQGIGMTDEEQARVFQSFTQANDAIKHQHGGTGLGLTISRSLIVQMGGRIDLSSRKGRGTCFSVVLPASVRL